MSIPSCSSDILIVGYPRSGNSYLARLLGDALDWPVTGLGSANPIASEGKDRPGPGAVRQLHLRALRRGGQWGLLDAYEFDLDAYAGERIVHIIRDPRDVAVSAWKFFDYSSLIETIDSMAGKAPGALGIHGAWDEYMGSWWRADVDNLVQLRYEDVLSDPVQSITLTLAMWGLLPARPPAETIQRQSFAAKRAQIERDGDTRPYGKMLQLKHLRRGVSGDWRNHFTCNEAKLAHAYFWPMLKELNYETDPDWWRLDGKNSDYRHVG